MADEHDIDSFFTVAAAAESTDAVSCALLTLLASSKGRIRFILMGAAKLPLTAEQLDKLGNAVEGIADVMGCSSIDVALAIAGVVHAKQAVVAGQPEAI